MSTQADRVAFITIFRDQYPHRDREACVKAAGQLLRLAKRHGALAVEECNGPGDYINRIPYPRWVLIDEWQAGLERRQAAVEAKIRALCAEWSLPVVLGGDPRGCTVRVLFPLDEHGPRPYNTWGGQDDGYGIPQ